MQADLDKSIIASMASATVEMKEEDIRIQCFTGGLDLGICGPLIPLVVKKSSTIGQLKERMKENFPAYTFKVVNMFNDTKVYDDDKTLKDIGSPDQLKFAAISKKDKTEEEKAEATKEEAERQKVLSKKEAEKKRMEDEKKIWESMVGFLNAEADGDFQFPDATTNSDDVVTVKGLTLEQAKAKALEMGAYGFSFVKEKYQYAGQPTESEIWPYSHPEGELKSLCFTMKKIPVVKKWGMRDLGPKAMGLRYLGTNSWYTFILKGYEAKPKPKEGAADKKADE